MAIRLPALVFLAAATGLAFAEGAIDSVAAWLCVLLAVVTAVGLVHLARRATWRGPSSSRRWRVGSARV